MKATKLTFTRYEKKYLLSAAQYEALWRELEPRLKPDEFFESTVCSLYYDDETYSMIRASIEQPVYKEKLRLRSYGVPGADDRVFVELKMKYNGVVYKRREALKESEAMAWLSGKSSAPEDNQISHEIDGLLSRYKVAPKAYISCDRRAYVAKDDSEVRLTFDSAIRFRDTELRLSAGSSGENLLENGQVLMELKLPGSAPLWLAHALSHAGVFPTSYSKYGTGYTSRLLHKYFDGVMEIA